MKSTLLAAGTALALSSGSAHAISIVNAGFEDPQATGTFSIPGNGPLPGWSIISGNVETVDAWAPSEGLRSLDLNGVQPGTIRQTLSGFQVGAAYELLFDLGGNYLNELSTKSARATIGSASQVFTHVLQTGDTRTDFTWQAESMLFEATAETQELTFAYVSGGAAAGAALDNIRVNLIAPVPVPAGLPLLLAGLSTFAWMRRRAA